jgi:hypothetical protein
MENMNCFVEMIHMEYRKLKYFHHFRSYIQELGVGIERLDVYGVPVGVPLTTEGEQWDMTIIEWGEGNNMSLLMVEDTYLHHKWVMGGRKG